MKKILFIGHRDRFYGAESVLFRIIEYCSKTEECHAVLPISLSKDFTDTLSSNKIESKVFYSCFRLVNPRLLLNLPSFLLSFLSSIHLIYYVKRYNIDVLFSNTCVNIIGAVVSIITNTKHIWHFHEQPTGGKFQWIPRFLYPVYRFLIQNKNTTIIFISTMQKALWEKEFEVKINKSIVLYTPPRLIERVKVSRNKHEITFGFLGSLNKSKNIIPLIEEFRKICIRYPSLPLKLKIMGDGILKSEVKIRLLKSEIANKAVLVEFNTDVANFFSTIDVLVLPSLFESWGLSALEALSLNKCLILTKNTALTEILENNIDCIFINPNKPNELFEAMNRLILNPHLVRKLKENGSKTLRSLNLEQNFNKTLVKLLNS